MDRVGLGGRKYREGNKTPAGLFFAHASSVFSDHEALESIVKVGEHNARVQRWLELLSSFCHTLVYRKGAANTNSDFLSRLPLPAIDADRHSDTSIAVDDAAGVYLIVRANGAIMIVRCRTSTWAGFPLASDEMCCRTRL